MRFKNYIILCIFLASFAAADFPRQSDVTFHHTFNDSMTSGSTSYDSAENYDGTIVGLTTGHSCVIGECYDYQGGNTDRVDLNASVTELNSTVNFSINFWASIDSYDDDWFFSQYDHEGKAIGMEMWDYSGQHVWVYWECYVGYDIDTLTSSPWTMYTIVWAGEESGYDKISLYVNGTEQAQGFSAGTCPSETQPDQAERTFNIGRRDKQGNQEKSIDGKIDEFTLWTDRALNQTEIDALYNSGSGVPYPPPPTPPAANYVDIDVHSPPDELRNNTADVNVTFYPSMWDSGNLSCTLNAQETNYTMIHNFEGAPVDWTAVDGNISQISTHQIRGDHYNELVVASDEAAMASRSIASANCSDADTFSIWVKVQNVSEYYTHPITGNTYGIWYIGQDKDNRYWYPINQSMGIVNQSETWYEVTALMSDYYIVGSPDISNLTWLRVYAYANNGSVTETGIAYDKFICYNSSHITRQTNNNYSATNNTKTVLNFTTATEGEYEYWVNCTEKGATAGNRTPDRTYTLDLTEPYIVYHWPQSNSHFTDNATVTLNVTLTDLNLFGGNFTIYNSSGTVMYNVYKNLTGLSSYNHAVDLNVSSWQVGTYTAKTQAWDSHTKKKIKPAESIAKDKKGRKLGYLFGDNTIEISLVGGNKLGQFENLDTELKDDRYNFIFDFKKDLPPNTEMVFRVFSSAGLWYLPESRYDAHFVTMDRKHWIDFEGVGGSTYAVTRVDKYNYDIEIVTGKNQKKFIFESLGSLNYNEVNKTFYKFTNITVFLNSTVNNTYLSNFSATVSWEGAGAGSYTQHIPGTNASMWLPADTTFSLNGTKPGYSIQTQNGLTNAFGPQTHILQAFNDGVFAYIYDEDTGLKILESIDITIDGGNGSHYTRETSNGELYMPAIPTGVYNMTFSSINYTPRTYILTISNLSITTMNAYLQRNSNTMIMTVVDKDTSRPIDGALVTIAKYINDTETIIAALPTDVTGRILFAYGTTTHYKFYVTHSDYTSRNFDLNPVKFSTYTVNMEKAVTIDDSDDFASISLVILPSSYSSGPNNGSVLLSAPYGNLISYWVNISYPGGALALSGSNPHGELVPVNINISGASFLDTVNYTVSHQMAGQDNKVHSYQYPIKVSSLAGTLADRTDYGLGLFDIILIVTIVTIAVGGTAAVFLGPEPGVIAGLLMLGFFVKIGLIPLLVVAIPLLGGFVFVVWGGRR